MSQPSSSSSASGPGSVEVAGVCDADTVDDMGEDFFVVVVEWALEVSGFSVLSSSL